MEDVLDSEEVQTLGDPIKVDSTTSMKPVSGVESREFDDPETKALTGVGVNMAKNLQSALSFDPDEDLDKQIEEALDSFAREFGSKGENAIYVQDKILEHLETDKASAFIKFQGIRNIFPVTLNSKDELEKTIDRSQYRFGEDYLTDLLGRVVNNNFAVPAIYAGENYFPREVPVTVVYSPDDALTLSPDDPFVNERIDDFDKGEGGFSDHPYVEEWQTDEGYELIIDCVGAGIESPEAAISGDKIVIYDDGEEVYRGRPGIDDLEELTDEKVEGEFHNGVYDLSI